MKNSKLFTRVTPQTKLFLSVLEVSGSLAGSSRRGSSEPPLQSKQRGLASQHRNQNVNKSSFFASSALVRGPAFLLRERSALLKCLRWPVPKQTSCSKFTALRATQALFSVGRAPEQDPSVTLPAVSKAVWRVETWGCFVCVGIFFYSFSLTNGFRVHQPAGTS